VRDFADSQEPDTGARAWHAVLAAKNPALLGAGLSAGGDLAARGLDAASVAARRLAIGGTAKDYGDIVKEQGTRRGIEFLQKYLGRIPEQQGLTNTLMPQSQADYAVRAADRTANVLGPQIGASLERAAGEIPAGAIDKGAVELELARKAQALEQAARPGARQFDQAISQVGAAPFETPADIARLKREFEAEAYVPTSVASLRDSRYAQAQKAGADATRQHLRDVMAQASPDTNQAFTQASADYGPTRLVEKMASKGAVRSMATPLAAGAALGGWGGYEARHDLRDAGVGAVGGAAIGALGKNYAPDLAANVARLGQRGASSIADNAPGLVRIGMLQLDLGNTNDPAQADDELERQRREAAAR
jgi:hypothetical protein